MNLKTLYTGTIRHRRFDPKIHEFNYSICLFCLNTLTVSQTLANRKGISIEGFNFFSFRRRDYLPDPTDSLDVTARKIIAIQTGIYPQGKIYVLTQLSNLGYCFNPINFYFVFAEQSEQLAFLLLEVTNTPWGKKHHYVIPLTDKEKQDQLYHVNFTKQLHVSPFMAMDYAYDFKLKLTGDSILVHLENIQAGEKHFDATLL